MIEFIVDDPIAIVGIMLLVVVVAIIIDWKTIKSHLIEFMVIAKDQAKDGILNSGQAQEDFVVALAYKYLPKRFTIFINYDRMHTIVRYFYMLLQDRLDDGEWNNSVT